MNKEICFFSNRPLMKRDVERFGFELLKNKGFKVFYLDISGICNRDYASYYEKDELAEYEGAVRPSGKKEVRDFLCAHKGLFGIDCMKPSTANMWFFRLLKRYGIIYASFCTSAIPAVGKPSGPELSMRTLRKFANKIKYLLMKAQASRIQKARYLIKGGIKDGTDYPNSGKDSEIIWAHALDYDLYLRFMSKGNETKVRGDYCVFLDEYFPLHPDHLIKGAMPNPYGDPKEYYEEINRVLDAIEKELKMPDVVAAHPRSKYESMDDPFKGRNIIKNRTVELVAGARLAVSHGSTSTNMAVLFEKPVLFYLPSRAKRSRYDNFIHRFADELGRTVHDEASLMNSGILKETAVDREKYGRYKADHIKKPGSPERYFWDIIADRIETK